MPIALAENPHRCMVCRAETDCWLERCPDCGRRGAMRPTWLPDLASAEEAVADEPAEHAERSGGGRVKRLSRVRNVDVPRIKTGIHGLDRVLGDSKKHGFAVPSFVLFGGSQGAGKSSLALQGAAGINPKHRVLYLLNEEPEFRLRDRAERLGLPDAAINHIEVCDSVEMEDYERAIEEVDPHVVVLDSLSMMRDSRHDVPDDQRNRTRYATWFFEEAMRNDRVVLAISHLNKEDDIAGARKIQYTIDAVMTITLICKGYSVLECPVKNRFGEPGVPQYFSIGKDGLQEVDKSEAMQAAVQQKAAEKAPDII